MRGEGLMILYTFVCIYGVTQLLDNIENKMKDTVVEV